MTTISETGRWEPAIYQIKRADKVEGGANGVANIQASQLAGRTRWLKDQVESASDYREYTFYKTESDPDGTLSGLANTPDGKMFRVVQGEGDVVSFIYYINQAGAAVKSTEMPAQGSIEVLSARAKNQSLSFGFFDGMSITSAAADIDGNCIYMTLENGDVYVATVGGMLPASGNAVTSKRSLSYGFHNGKKVLQVNTDKDGNIISLSTQSGTTVSDGESLVDISPEINAGSQNRTLSYGFVNGLPVAKLTVDIETGEISEITSLDGNVYTFSNGVLTKLTDIVAQESGIPYNNIYTGIQKTYKQRDMSFYSPDPNVIYIFIDMGQSNSWGQYSGGVPTIAGVPVYPDNALMLNTGVRATLTEATSLVPLVETNAGIASETSGSSWVNHTIRDMEALTGVRPTILMLNASQGGMRYYQLTRGQTAYKQFQAALKSAVSLIRARGKKPVIAAVRWMQGESELSFVPSNKPTVQAQLRQLQRFVADDASQITGTPQDPLLFVNQVSPVSKYADGIWRQPVKEAQLLREGKIIPVGPVFQYPMADGVHMNSWGRNYLGQCLAMATVTEVFGSSYAPQLPGEYAWIDDVTLRINLDAAFGPLTLDTSGTVSMTGLENYGFNFDDYSATPPVITAVTLNESSIDITLNKSPRRSWRLAYAMKPTGDNAGPVTGARGCLRDSAGHQNLYDTSVVTHNWYPSFIIHSR
ncbi:sialate O-acetylesterase [Klebsiella variicola]|uniref:sialate O-acetylesterase n=1 Tax=Klebsiella variicola TaxID=244366 RepID=UPI0010333646|nr:sialate O-acetylesterase [Klebsiella variicola]